MKTKLFTVYGYDLTDPEWGHRSAGSFKLDLRNACKNAEEYWSGVPNNDRVKNLGQLVFGVPDKWKGLFEMRYRENGDTADIEVFLDRRINMFADLLPEIKSLLQKGLESLQNEGIIKNFQPVKESHDRFFGLDR